MQISTHNIDTRCTCVVSSTHRSPCPRNKRPLYSTDWVQDGPLITFTVVSLFLGCYGYVYLPWLACSLVVMVMSIYRG